MASGTRKNRSQKNQEDIKHVLENLFDCDLEDKEESAFVQVFQELSSIGDVDALITLCAENLRTFHSHLSRKTKSILWCSIMSIKRLQLFLKHLQQRGHYEIGTKFDYSSIDDNYFFNFLDHLSNDLRSGMDPRPVFISSTPVKLLDSLE